MDKVIEYLYGGKELIHTDQRTVYKENANAYMLQYIRKSDKEIILCDADEQNIDVHLRERLRRELQESKEEAKADAYTIVKVANDGDFAQQVGRNIIFDLVDFNRVRSFRVWNSMMFNIFKELIAKEIGLPVQLQQYQLWAIFENGSCRPCQPLAQCEDSYTVGLIKRMHGIHGELKLFLEVDCRKDLPPMPLYFIRDDILLFFKVYDPEKQELRYSGKLLVKQFSIVLFIVPKLKELAGFDHNEDIELFKEIGFVPYVMCEPINKLLSFTSNKLKDGDIICFQKSLSPQTRGRFLCPDVPTYLQYQHNRQEFAEEFDVPTFQHYWRRNNHQHVMCRSQPLMTLLDKWRFLIISSSPVYIGYVGRLTMLANVSLKKLHVL